MKKILFIISLILSSFAIQAQDARALFDSIPASVIPLLSPVNRADFIDFLESNMKAEVKNKFGNASEMTDLAADFIRIKMTERSTWEMKLLPLNDSVKIVCVVSTVCAPVCDSDVRFYTADWKEIPAKNYLAPPAIDEYFQLPDSTRLHDFHHFRQKSDMLLAKAVLSKEDNTITFTFTTPEYDGNTEADDTEEINDTDRFLRQPIKYTWEYDSSAAGYLFRKADTE